MSEEPDTSQAEDAFVEVLQTFVEAEQAEVVLLLADDAALQKIVIAGSSIDVARRGRFEPPSNASRTEVWTQLWECVEFSIAQLAERSGLTRAFVERRLPQLVANRVLYPDGSVHSSVQLTYARRFSTCSLRGPGGREAVAEAVAEAHYTVAGTKPRPNYFR